MIVGGANAAQTASPGDVVITEIMYNAASSEATTQTQYIELFNTTGSAIDLSNWTIDDEDADGPNTIPAGTTIPSGGIIVITGSSQADFTGAWGTASVSLLDDGQTMFNMSNSPSATSEIIELRDAMSNLIDTVNYDDSAPWPTDNGASSIYLTVQVNDISNDNGANWASSTVGTGGAYTATASGVWDSGADVGSPGVGYTPTAVSLQSITAPNQIIPMAVLTAGIIVLALFSMVILWQRRHS